jgi:hypothetical protein
MRIEADAGSISSAGSKQIQIGSAITNVSTDLTSAAESGAAGAGTPGLGEAITGAVQSWQGSLAMISDSVSGIGRNLSASATAYEVVDETAIPAGG